MTEKSHVTMETRQCAICGCEFTTGTILIDKRLMPRFERNTCVGWGLCSEHELATTRDGMIAVIEIDESKSDIGPDNKVSLDGAWRTGRVILMKRDFLQSIVDVELPKEPFVMVDKAAMSRLLPDHVLDNAPMEQERVPGSTFVAPGSDSIN